MENSNHVENRLHLTRNCAAVCLEFVHGYGADLDAIDFVLVARSAAALSDVAAQLQALASDRCLALIFE